MLGHKTLLIFTIAIFSVTATDFSGALAMEHVKKAVSFGPRPAGSPAILKLQDYIHQELAACKCEVSDDAFAAQTPNGVVSMKNIIARFRGSQDTSTVPSRPLVVTGHYDTKLMEGFVGANDGGSSTGLLLELARVLATTPHRTDIYLVWLDGEEAVRYWSQADSTYGSRHLAALWETREILPKIAALINVDMIGDKDLEIPQESNSSAHLRGLARRVATDLGYAKHFPSHAVAIEDDHLPFLERGVPAIDLIDFSYGPGNSWWHTTADTIDKLSPQSLEIVGNVVLKMLHELELPSLQRVIE